MEKPTTHFSPRLGQQGQLSVRQVAAMLEERLYDPRLSLAEFAQGCRTARDIQLAAVVAPPSRVALAANILHGSGVRVAAAVTADFPPTEDLPLAEVLRRTERLLRDGAGVIGVVVGRGRLTSTARARLADEIRAVTDLVRPARADVRTMLGTAGMTRGELILACQLSVDSGATMVQGGTWLDDDRASLSQVALMRQTLGEKPLLKWTAPIRSVDRLLLACAEGVDRFNADPTAILRQAALRARDGGLRLPQPGTDY